ncbi:MAG: polysaccharide deacetylase family protein [Sphingobium sp.]
MTILLSATALVVGGFISNPDGFMPAPMNPMALAAEPVAAPHCASEITGRALTVTQPSFGKVQGQPLLPLKRGEYVLTFDDGPSKQTRPLLDILGRYCVRATFMMIGRKAEARPELVKEIMAAGHGVGSHSFIHNGFGALDAVGQDADILHGDDAVARAIDGAPRTPGRKAFFRMPGDKGVPMHTPAETLGFLKEKGLILAGYDISPQDWRNNPSMVSYERLFKNMPDRGVIVMHDFASNTPMLLELSLMEFKRRGARIVSLKLP